MRFHELQMQQESFDSDSNFFTLEADDVEEPTDEDTLDSVDDTQESMTAAYCDFMLESSRLMASVYETDVVCCEAYEAATTVTEREEVTALYENKVVDFIKKIGTKLKNALLAVWNWVKQFVVKYYNKIKGFFKSVLTNKDGLKDPQFNDVEFKNSVVLKGDIKSIMLGSDLYKAYEEMGKLGDEYAKSTNEKKGFEEFDKKLTAIINKTTVANGKQSLIEALVDKKDKVKFSEIRDAVIAVAGKNAEMLKVASVTVEQTIKRQISRLEQRIKELEAAGHTLKTSLTVKILQKQNTYLNAIATTTTSEVTKAINFSAKAAKTITDKYKKTKESKKDKKKNTNESLVLDLESRLCDI